MSDVPHETAAPSPTDPQPGTPAAIPVDNGASTTPSAADAGADTPETDDGEGEQPKPKKSGGFQKRIHEQTAKIRSLERQLAEVTAPKADASATDAAPKREDFASYDEYIGKHARWEARDEVKRSQRETIEQATATARQDLVSEFGSNMSKDAAEDPAFAKSWQTFTRDNYPISPAMLDFVAESDDPNSIVEWLANNHAEAATLYHAPASQVARTLARVEAKLVASASARTPQAPPPPPTVGGRSTPRVDAVKLAGSKNPDDYIRMRREQMAKEH